MKNLLKTMLLRLQGNFAKILSVICILMCSSASFAQTTWTGAVDDDWSVAGNWTAGVPDATDIVTIPNVQPNPRPVIKSGVVGVARSVSIEAASSLDVLSMGSLTIVNEDNLHGLQNFGIFTTAGTVIIATNGYGIENRATMAILAGAQVTIADFGIGGGIFNSPNGFFVNSGTIEVGFIQFSHWGIINQGIINNQLNGKIRVGQFVQTGVVVGALSTFNNLGTLEIGHVEGYGTVALQSFGEFTNGESAILRIDQASVWGIENGFESNFTNYGTINLGSSIDIGNGIENKNVFNHFGGEITINNYGFKAIVNRESGEFYSRGIIRIGNISLDAEYGIDNRGIFQHQLGEIHIDRFTLWGLHNHSEAEFINQATINIGSLGPVGTNGIRNEAPFTNSGGIIRINNTTQTGLLNSVATFHNFNNGVISIGELGSVGQHALRVENASTFWSDGPVTLDRFTDSGLRINSGMYVNNSNLSIGSSGESTGWSIFCPNGPFNNAVGSGMQLYAPVSLGNNAFTNLGSIDIITTEPHVNGGFTNQGIIGYRYGNPIPNVINENIIAVPISGECGDIPNALQLGNNVTFEMSENWQRVTNNLPVHAGTYDQGSNIFSPTDLPPGSSVLVLFFTDPINDYSGFVTTSVTMEDVTPPSVECFDFELVLNGEEEVELDPIDLAIAFDNCGIPTLELSPSTIQCTMIGQVIPVTVTASDGNQSAQCISQVTIGGLPCGWSQHPDGINCPDGSSVTYDHAKETFEISSENCFYAPPFQSDVMAYAKHTLCGNGSITVEVISIEGANAWAGILMRENGEPGSKKVQISTNKNSNLTRREVRTVTNGSAQPQQVMAYNRFWLRISRQGNQFVAHTSANGIQWSQVLVTNIPMNECIEMGMIVSNYNSNSIAKATFGNVSTEGNANEIMPVNPTDHAAIPHVQQISELSISPNPTDGEINIDLSLYLQKNITIEVYGSQGQLLQFKEIKELNGSNERLNLSEYPGGLYLVSIKSPGIPDVTKRIIRQ